MSDTQYENLKNVPQPMRVALLASAGDAMIQALNKSVEGDDK